MTVYWILFMFRQMIFQGLFWEFLHALFIMFNRNQLCKKIYFSVQIRIEGLRIWNTDMEHQSKSIPALNIMRWDILELKRQQAVWKNMKLTGADALGINLWQYLWQVVPFIMKKRLYQDESNVYWTESAAPALPCQYSTKC